MGEEGSITNFAHLELECSAAATVQWLHNMVMLQLFGQSVATTEHVLNEMSGQEMSLKKLVSIHQIQG